MKAVCFKIMEASVLAVALAGMVGCSRMTVDVGDGGNGSGVVRRIVTACADGPSALAVDMKASTRTSLSSWDEGKNYSVVQLDTVMWEPGDIVYCYAESGVFMFDILTLTSTAETRIDPTDHRKTKIEIIYREGDSWYVAYQKGSAIGDYIGRRTRDGLTFKNGIPRNQNGEFSPYHVSVACEYPLTEEDVIFRNMQSYVRFTCKGVDGNGKLVGKTISKMVFHNTVNLTRPDNEKAMMAGNLELDIKVENAWRSKVVKSGDPLDSTITVTPSGAFTTGRPYYVAVPSRTYTSGILVDLYDPSGVIIAQLQTPRVEIATNQIYEVQDILEFVKIICTDIKLKFGGDYVGGRTKAEADAGTAVTIQKGHTGMLVAELLPEQTTDKSVLWKSLDSTIVKVGQDGSIFGVDGGDSGKTTYVTAHANGGFDVEAVVKVTVEPQSGLTLGGYGTPTPYKWPDER